MHESYRDIRSRIAEEPKWWDEHAVPRYEEFECGLIANIYAQECCLLEIACQDCGYRFMVAMSRGRYMDHKIGTLRSLIENKSIHYGDPPNAGCCQAGPTMNCDDLRVIQYWARPRLEWIRDPNLEIDLQ